MVLRFEPRPPSLSKSNVLQSVTSENSTPLLTRLNAKLIVLAQTGNPCLLNAVESLVDLMLKRLGLILLCLSLVGCGAVAFAAGSVSVHVFTAHDPSGLTDDATASRLTAVEDIKKRLRKNADVTLVDDPSAAKVQIEVISAGAEAGTNRTVATTTVVAGTAITNPGTALPDYVGRATITSGTFKTNIESSLGPFGRTYGENLARKFEDWLKKNAKALR